MKFTDEGKLVTDQPTNGRTKRPTHPLIEMRWRILKRHYDIQHPTVERTTVERTTVERTTVERTCGIEEWNSLSWFFPWKHPFDPSSIFSSLNSFPPRKPFDWFYVFVLTVLLLQIMVPFRASIKFKKCLCVLLYTLFSFCKDTVHMDVRLGNGQYLRTL